MNLGNVKSDPLQIKCGVPQGSVFGPYYSYYTSMIFRIQTYLISTFFADDLSLFCANRSLLDLESSVNDQLKNFHNWLCANKLSLNIKRLVL